MKEQRKRLQEINAKLAALGDYKIDLENELSDVERDQFYLEEERDILSKEIADGK